MTTFRTVKAGGVDVFFREAGDPGAPKLLLLGGFPASSHQFRNLIPALADRFHVVSPDYPGFGNTEMPDPAQFDYTFDHLADVVDELLERIGFTGPMGIYMQDYGGPIGNRLIDRHRDWLSWQVIQNANLYVEGFTDVWAGVKAMWQDRNPQTEAPVEGLLGPEGIETVYVHGAKDPTLISPDNWNMDLWFLSRPHAHKVQLDLFYDYQSNLALYPQWQEALRTYQPKTLVLWGQNDIFLTPEGGEAYLRDLPDAQLVRLDSGHMAVEDRLEEIVDAVNAFYAERVAG
ncbi:pimeloyl-ACP methyl ester carboxylesterase [Asanoa ferruginea]|uniref:Pimeloyl-ACP methyl ester carboxylesterase n=1 Tax=Asanoa ferruginea TaxID=53367 RepID=A0A3D9ZTP8_9ACTN|nr:alpha/beta fold hydrolase [Asanoa ferruginea]REG00546.1 pimeloyl-ACP methyl ester carboxylesterase [Asanoa ferruginea]GIF47709.1 hydrolase [Asanoa ferruginea]